MSDWFVFSRDPHGRDAKSRKLPNEEAAVTLAGDLMLQKYEIIRIEGPNAQVIHKREIERKVGLTA
jgi:hypothetical protein